MNSDGWVDVDEYTKILKWIGKVGTDIDAAIEFLFGVYDVKGMLPIGLIISYGKHYRKLIIFRVTYFVPNNKINTKLLV